MLLQTFADKKRRGEAGIRNASINQKNRDLTHEAQKEQEKQLANSNAVTGGLLVANNAAKIGTGLETIGVLSSGATAATVGATSAAAAAKLSGAVASGATQAGLIGGSASLTAAAAIPYIGWGIALAGMLGWF